MIHLIPFYFLALFIIFIAFKINKNLVRIDYKAVALFAVAMIAFSVSKFAFYKVFGVEPPAHYSGFTSLFFVWWEDAVFVLPLLILNHYGFKMKYQMPFIILSSIAFASGHLSYSIEWAVFLLCYVYFISYSYGLRYGLGTVMICHVFYDLITVFTTFLL